MKRVLIVDDDERIRLVISKFLSDKWYEIAEADSGQQALDLYPVFRPDVYEPG